MSVLKTAKKSSSNGKIWVLTLFTLMVLTVALTFSYRERVIVSLTNHFAGVYGIEVKELDGLSIQFDMQASWFIDKITLDKAAVKIDYLQFQQTTQKSANQVESATLAAPLTLPQVPYWIPDLHIATITLQGTNLPDIEDLNLPVIVDKALILNTDTMKTFEVKDIKFRYLDNRPEFGFSLWQQNLRLLQFRLRYTDSQALIKAQVTTDLAHITKIVAPLLPDLDTRLSGLLTLDASFGTGLNTDTDTDTALASKLINQVALKLSLSELGLSHNQHMLIEDADLSVDTAVIFEDQRWLAEQVHLAITDLDEIRLTASSCTAYIALLGMDNTICQSFNKIASPRLTSVVITPELPLFLRVDIHQQEAEPWVLHTKRVAINAAMTSESSLEDTLAVKVEDVFVTSQSLQADWSLALQTNSHHFSEIDASLQLESSGRVNAEQLTASMAALLTIDLATLTVPELEYSGLSSEHIKIALLEEMTINIKNNQILPFDFALSTASYNNHYLRSVANNASQQYDIMRFTAQHRGRFMHELIAVNSDWQFDDAELKSNNQVELINLKPNQLKGHLLLPKQAIPGLITDNYPLPEGLYLTADITNRLDYRLRLDEPKAYLSAVMSGELTADSSTFNDILATDITTDWHCTTTAEQADLAASLLAKCNIRSEVASVDMGPVVTDVNFSGLVTYTEERMQVAVDNASAKAFSGTISLSPLLITDFDHIVGQVKIRDLSLPEILELYQVPGVKVTGVLKADLPFIAEGAEVSITDGSIAQQGAGGVIQIKDNVTVEQLKLTQPQLRYALELLENLHYDSLYSDVNFKPNGETKLTINIKGRNPSVERPIEFNYSHEENILQLFRSLRINDSMYDALDKMNNP